MNFFKDSKNIIIVSLFVILCVLLFVSTSCSKQTHEHLSFNIEKPLAHDPTIINFYSSWCPHCEKFKSTWEDFKKTMVNKKIRVTEVQCDTEENVDICKKYNIMGYPTVKLFINNNDIEFLDSRNVSNLVQFCQRYIKNL